MIMVLKRRNTTAPVEDVGDVQGVDRISGDGPTRWGDTTKYLETGYQDDLTNSISPLSIGTTSVIGGLRSPMLSPAG